MNRTIIIDLQGCARCAGSHTKLAFTPLTRPVELDDDAALTHWSLCPTLTEPILLRVEAVG